MSENFDLLDKKIKNLKLKDRKVSLIRRLFGLKDKKVKTDTVNVRIILFKGDDDILDNSSDPKILLCRLAKNGYWVIPKVKINVEEGLPEEKLSEELIIKSFRYFEYFYDMKFISCCKNKIYKIKDDICFILGPNEWKGTTKLPLPPIYPHFDALMWFDPKEAFHNREYLGSLKIGEETLNIIKVLVPFFRYVNK